MATLLSSIRTDARTELIETAAVFWTDAELLVHTINGAKDLWGAIVDLHQEHFLTDDITNVSFAASATSLTGVPTDCFRVHLIEPRDTTDSGSHRSMIFVPRDFNSKEFISARAMSSIDPANGGVLYFTLIAAGHPVGAPTVKVSPKLTAALNLRFVYVPGLGTLTAANNNPIPGESDNALIAWTIAYALAKEREDRSPDPNWLAIYATEKQNILTRLTPRQTQEPDIAEGIFEDLW